MHPSSMLRQDEKTRGLHAYLNAFYLIIDESIQDSTEKGNVKNLYSSVSVREYNIEKIHEFLGKESVGSA